MRRNRIVKVISGSLIVVGIIVLYQHAFFVAWLNLGNPLTSPRSGEKVEKILGASPREIRVGTNQGRAFETDLPWIAWQRSPKEFLWRWHEAPYEKINYSPANFGCPFTFWLPPLLPAMFHGISDQVQVKGCRLYVGIEQADYLILGDGTVWVWQQQRYIGNE